MKTTRSDKIKVELQLLTGVITDDINYMCYLLLKDGVYFNKDKNIEIDDTIEKEKIAELSCESLDDYFNSL